MMSGRYLAALAVASFALASSAIACSGGASGTDGGVDSSTDVSSRDSATDSPSTDGGRGPVLVELLVTATSPPDGSPPLALVPTFSPDVHDYYVRCAAGTNALRVSMKASSGAESLLLQPSPPSSQKPEQTVAVGLDVNAALVAAARKGATTVEYWVRCLPPDFPDLRMETYPEAGAPAPGYYLLGNYTAVGPDGGYAMVLNGDGVPVWYFHDLSGGVCDVDAVVEGGVSFFHVAHVDGGPLDVVGLSPFRVGSPAPLAVAFDTHELVVLPNGHYLAISDPDTTGVDLTGLALPEGDGGSRPLGPGSTLRDCNIVEFDPVDGAVAWTWKATDHFNPVEACKEPTKGPPTADGGLVVDTFHCNSIDVDPANGNLLVSARQLDSVFYIDRSTGKVLWKMGGDPRSLDNATFIAVADPFYEQHDARLLPGWAACKGGQISLFDDETFRPGPARAILYDVVVGGGDGGCAAGTDGGAMATVNAQYPGHSVSVASGSFRISPDGSRVIGWGFQAEYVFTELDGTGHVLRELRSAADGGPGPPPESYRAIKVPLSAFDLNALRNTAGHSSSM